MPGAASLFALTIFLFCANANAFVRTLADSGRPLYWANPALSIKGNPQNSSGLSHADVQTMLSSSFSAWTVPGTYAWADYSQSTGFPANSNNDGLNAAYFSTAGGRQLDYGVVAITEVLYYVSSGQIAETDIVFNDHRFRFTANEGDTGKVIGGKTAIYLRDVATHEAGHAFGLDHTNVNLSSLMYTAFSGQFSLSEDDKTAISTTYPSTGGRGTLVGNVNGRNGGIFGAHIEAINLSSGEIQAGAVANPDGSFRLGDLPPGQYAVLMEPFGSDISSVSSYFQNVNHRFCASNQKFRRKFYGPCGSREATVVEVRAATEISLGTLAPSCTQMGNPGGSPTSLETALDFPSDGGALFGTLRAGDVHYYSLRNVSGDLRARAFAYTLYSPIDVKVEIVSATGDPLNDALSIDNIEEPMPGGYINYDSEARARLVTGDYFLKVQANPRRLYSPVFPAGFDLLDGDGHYLLSLSVDGQHGAPSTSDMSACASMNNPLQNASTRAPASRRQEESSGGCGALSSGGSPWSGGLMQILTVAFLVQAFMLANRRKAALVRKRK